MEDGEKGDTARECPQGPPPQPNPTPPREPETTTTTDGGALHLLYDDERN